MDNILYVHEIQPFETYRQLQKAMNRYLECMVILGGCQLLVTPLGSKLITLGAGLACSEMRTQDLAAKYGGKISNSTCRAKSSRSRSKNSQ